MANRRKFLAGLGALASGSAAAMGTGAFTSVSADRNVDVKVADDSASLLALSPAGTNNSDLYVYDDTPYGSTAQVVGINLDGGQGSATTNASDAASGVNPNGTTIINDLITVKNQGSQSVDLSIDTQGPNGSSTSDVEFYTGPVDSGTRIDDGNGTVSLAVGSETYLSMKIDLNGGDPGQILNLVEINAEA